MTGWRAYYTRGWRVRPTSHSLPYGWEDSMRGFAGGNPVMASVLSTDR
ncbi:MAG: hypothetical protein QI199_05280 [Candidatus Korarchaeota archaeon]|nr:hypothetical protein [Candidatus Korarchaeota archaeon]